MVGGTLHLGTALNHTFSGADLTAGTLSAGLSTLKVNFTGLAWTGVGTNFTAGTGTVNLVVSLKHWQQLPFSII
jgi:hypothetical protein